MHREAAGGTMHIKTTARNFGSMKNHHHQTGRHVWSLCSNKHPEFRTPQESSHCHKSPLAHSRRHIDSRKSLSFYPSWAPRPVITP
ncbi:hypothetical protein SCA6_013899 [Theobroma cacao]